MTQTSAAGAPAAVVIGGSAGSFEVLDALLPALPASFSPALLVVTHHGEQSGSLLAGLLAERCRLPVVEASDKQPIRGGAVYVAPPRYHLLVEADCTCSLAQKDPARYSRPSIDALFETAATAYADRLLGILLSGANDDGVAGLLAIRASGGITWAQDPASASAPFMPRAAIDRGAACAVLGIDAMQQALSAQRNVP